MADEKLNTQVPSQPNPDEIQKLVHREDVQKAIAESIKTEEDILLQPVPDRRKLPHVPDASQRRTHVDRRGYCENAASRQDYEQSKAKEDTGRRYIVDYPLKLNIKTSTITENGNKSVIGVVLGDDSEPKNSLHVSLKKIDSSWKIISVTE